MGVSSSKPHPVQTKWFNDFEAGLPSLTGKTVVITGTTSGTGFVIARTAIRKGAENVFLLNRPSERATKAESMLKEEAKSTKVETIPCDLQDFASVKEAAQIIKSKVQAVDVLCNNAGVMALEDKATKDGYDVQMQTNHLSHFLLTKELYPSLKKAAELRGEARIANHSSGARKFPNSDLEEKYLGKNGGNLGGNGSSMFLGGARWVRYHQTKLANAVFTLALNDRLGSNSKVIATVAEPGLAATNLQTTTAQDGGMSAMWIMRLAQSSEDGSMPILSACFAPNVTPGKMWAPSQRGGTVGPAVEGEMDKLSTKEHQRALLWKASEEAVGKFDI